MLRGPGRLRNKLCDNLLADTLLRGRLSVIDPLIVEPPEKGWAISARKRSSNTAAWATAALLCQIRPMAAFPAAPRESKHEPGFSQAESHVQAGH